MRRFRHFAVIDWSGEAVAKPKGLAAAHLIADQSRPALHTRGGRWSREAMLSELLQYAEARSDILIGLDLSPALPFVDRGAYFPGWPESPSDAPSLWRLVDELSSDDAYLGVRGFLSHPIAGEHFLHQDRAGLSYTGGGGRLRRCEIVQRDMNLNPYSCFRLIGSSQVGKSSLTGMRVLNRLNGRIPVWPFDPVPESGPLIVEIYTSLAAREANVLPRNRSKIASAEELEATLSVFGCRPPREEVSIADDHATDAMVTVAWLRRAAERPELWSPPAHEAEACRTEGWTFGVTWR